MADNVTLNTGTGGAVLATQDMAGVEHQRVLVEWGPAGTVNQVDNATGKRLPVDGSGVTQPVSGTVTANAGTGTLAISAASLPLPTGAATAAKQPALGTAGVASADVLTVQGVALMTALKVDGSAVTQPVSAASLPLPTGASTAAKQPALGTAGAAATDVLTVQGIAAMTALKVDGSAVTQPVSGTVTTSPPANASSNVAQINGAAPLMGNGVTGTGSPRVTVASDNTPFTVKANLEPETAGGLSMSHVVSAATTNATSLKASAGQVYGIQVFNLNAAARYLKLYDKASAPTVGTDTPVKTLLIPGNTAGTGLILPIAQGLAFASGIAWALTTGMADVDTGAVAAADIVVNIDYK